MRIALGLILGFTMGNLLSVALNIQPSVQVAIERSFFQAVAIMLHYFLSRTYK